MADLKPVFVVSAPSGAGKTTLNRMFVERHSHYEISVSLTSRDKRPGEIHGKDYFFVTRTEFETAIAKGEMLEWAVVHDHLYGTSKTQLMAIESRNAHAILEIDVQGWLQAKQKLKKAISIFILPPSLQELWTRLEKRGTDSIEVRWKRFINAKAEIERGMKVYDFYIINNDLKTAFTQLEEVILQSRNSGLNPSDGRVFCEKLLNEFEHSAWFFQLKKKFAIKFP